MCVVCKSIFSRMRSEGFLLQGSGWWACPRVFASGRLCSQALGKVSRLACLAVVSRGRRGSCGCRWKRMVDTNLDGSCGESRIQRPFRCKARRRASFCVALGNRLGWQILLQIGRVRASRHARGAKSWQGQGIRGDRFAERSGRLRTVGRSSGSSSGT